MIVLANKVAHQDLDRICQVKASQLYEKAKYQEIPFHEWGDWVEKQLNDLYLKAVYENKSGPNTFLTKTSTTQNSEDRFVDVSLKRKSISSDRDQLRKYFSDKSKNGNYHALSDEELKPSKK